MKKILIVDDEPDFLKVIKLRLASYKYKVIMASSGKEALAKIKREKPDAVLLDILMPGLDGLQTLKKIRSTNKKLPVYIITAFSNEERFKLARKLSASGFIVKTASLKKEMDHITAALRLADKFRGKRLRKKR